jgi:hypothetical protein
MLRDRKSLVLLIVVTSLVFGMYGCGKINPTAPENESLTAESQEPPKAAFPAEVLWPKLVMIDSTTYCHEAEVYVDRWNHVELDIPGHFVVPENSVEEDVTINIDATRGLYWDDETWRWSRVAFFEFGPEGLTFGNGSTDDEYDGGDGDSYFGDDDDWHYGGFDDWDYDDDWYSGYDDDNDGLAYLSVSARWLGLYYGDHAVLRYLNQDTGLWEELSSAQVNSREVKFYFEHFSRYAISR